MESLRNAFISPPYIVCAVGFKGARSSRKEFVEALDILLLRLVYNHKVIKLVGYGIQFGEVTPQHLDTTFAALADPTRRAILARLVQGEASVQELAEPFAMSQPAISKHLRVLERAGLISRGRDAQRRPCRLEAQPLAEANEWLERYRECWEQNFQRLDALLEELKAQDSRGKAVKTRQKTRTHARR
jgi:DNA-binding transcriptional ArsR family regulator